MHDLNWNNGQYGYAGLQKGWHGLGQIMNPDASMEEWARAANMDFTILSSPVQFTDDTGRLVQAENRNVLYHSGTGDVLNVVSDRYKAVQPAEVLSFFADMNMETAGTLGNGAKYWGLARVGDNFSVAGDEHAPYVLVSTSCDGTLATSATFTAIRVVCSNTLHWALHNAEGVVKTRHSKEWKADQVRAQLGIISENAEETISDFSASMNELASIQVTRMEVARFLANVIGDKKALEVAPVTSNTSVDAPMFSVARSADDVIQAGDRKLSALWDTYNTGQGQDTPAARGTLYGAVQAVTRHVDHVQGRSEDTRRASAWFGAGSNLKQRAVTLAEEYAQAA